MPADKTHRCFAENGQTKRYKVFHKKCGNVFFLYNREIVIVTDLSLTN